MFGDRRGLRSKVGSGTKREGLSVLLLGLLKMVVLGGRAAQALLAPPELRGLFRAGGGAARL